MRRTLYAVAILVSALAAWDGSVGAGEADPVEQLKAENAQLRQRLDRVEGRLRMLLKTVQDLKVGTPTPPVPPPPKPPALVLTPADVAALKGMLEAQAKAPPPTLALPSVVSGLHVRLYGMIKADAAYDSSRTSVGDFARWVDSEERRGNDPQFNLTIRQTRLGLLFTGKESAAPIATGRIEVDFYGEATQENKPSILVRHAYLNLHWPERGLALLAGQTSDVISPLLPGTLNYAVGWWAGNIGYRHPQLRVTRKLPLTELTELTVQAALSRTVGTSTLFGFDPGDTGEDSAHPTLQARLALATPLLGDQPTVLGVSGHYGDEEYDLDDRGHSKDFHSWSLNLDLTQPISPTLTLKGEAFVGENLDDYLGGIGQGIDLALRREVGSRGGWLAAAVGPYGPWQFHLGASAEDTAAGDLSAPGARTFNSSIFGNVLYSFGKHTQVGFELSHWRTDYKRLTDGDSLRGQMSFIHKF